MGNAVRGGAIIPPLNNQEMRECGTGQRNFTASAVMRPRLTRTSEQQTRWNIAMADSLYVSIWFPSFREGEIMPRTVSVLRQFPFSAVREGITYSQGTSPVL